MLSKTLLTISVCLLLSGCWWNTKPDPPQEPVVLVKYIHSQCGNPPQRSSVNLRPVNWEIVGDRFTLTPQGYEDLSYNVTEIWSGVAQLKTEIEYYEKCLQEVEDTSFSSLDTAVQD